VVRHPARQAWRYGYEERPKHTFRVLPRRWVVERTFAWLGQSRRSSKDYERLPSTSEATIYGAMRRLVLRRLARPVAAGAALARPTLHSSAGAVLVRGVPDGTAGGPAA
jgi:hypothetical protein